MHHGRFRDGRLTTGFIAEEYPDGFHGRAMDDAERRRFAAAAVAAKLMRTERAGAHLRPAQWGRAVRRRSHVVMLGEDSFEVRDASLDGEPSHRDDRRHAL